MKTKRVVLGGAGAYAGVLARQSAPLMLAVALLGATTMACKFGGSGQENGAQENGAPANPGPAPVAEAVGGDVVRYSGMEVNETGQTGIRQAVQARRAADWSSTTVATLYPGTVVSRVARYGNYSLVAWTGSAGAQQGWVDSNVAFTTLRRLDAGTDLQPPTVFGVGPINQPPVATVAPPPVATAAPPPVATVAPPPVATATAPKPTATAPAPTATAPKIGFRPPRLK